jgi:hypothetical protein
MKARLLGLSAALLVAAGSAAAQSVGGNYTVRGTNFDGSTYSGTAQITASGSGCRIVWQTGSTSSRGTCMLANHAFAAHYRMGDRWGLVVYELQSDGSLTGWWTITDKDGTGTETLTPR